MTVDSTELSTLQSESYSIAQKAMADLKSAIYTILAIAGKEGLRNADIGRALGIYAGHEKHEGHIPRTLLAMMEKEGVVEQDPQTKRWHLSLALKED